MKPRPPVIEEAAGRDVEMVDAELGGEMLAWRKKRRGIALRKQGNWGSPRR